MAIIEFYEHAYLPAIGCPIAVVVAETEPNRRQGLWESYVLLRRDGQISSFESYKQRFSSPEGNELLDDYEYILRDEARTWAEEVVDKWQQGEYRKRQAMHLFRPVVFVKSTERLLVTAWISGIATTQFNSMVKTSSQTLRDLLTRIMRLPRVIRY